MPGTGYVLVWADLGLHLRVLGIYATRRDAEQGAADDAGMPLHWLTYRDDTPPCWFANVPTREFPGPDPERGCDVIAERRLPS
jgi:hypothetical protein